MENFELEKLKEMVSNIEKSITKMQVSNKPIYTDGEFGKTEKRTSMENEGIAEENYTLLKEYDCGCPTDGTGRDYGGRCFNHLDRLPMEVERRDAEAGVTLKYAGRPLYMCKRHITTCWGCGRILICKYCWKELDGRLYCNSCRWLIRLGLKRKK